VIVHAFFSVLTKAIAVQVRFTTQKAGLAGNALPSWGAAVLRPYKDIVRVTDFF
jgi:hypothetical protein